MCGHRDAAFRAVTSLLGFGLMVRTAFAAAGVGVSSLWNCHGSNTSKLLFFGLILGNLDEPVHLLPVPEIQARRLFGQENSVNPRWVGLKIGFELLTRPALCETRRNLAILTIGSRLRLRSLVGDGDKARIDSGFLGLVLAQVPLTLLN